MENQIYIFNENRKLIYVSSNNKNCAIALFDICKIKISSEQVLKVAGKNGLIIVEEIIGNSSYQLSFQNLYKVGIDGFKEQDFQN